MFHRWAARVLVLALCALPAKNAAGQQQQQPRGHGAKGKIGTSWPNPSNPDVKLAFTVGDSSCAPGSERHVVNMQIVNMLSQPVVVPVLYDASATSPTNFSASLKGQPITSMTLSCGEYVAYWSGLLRDGREAPSGIYGVLLFVDGVQTGSSRIYRKK